MFRYVCSFAGCTVKPQSEWKDSDTEASDAWDNRPYDRAIRNQAIDECASAFDLAAKNFQDDHAAILSMRSPVAGSMLSLLFGMADSLRHLIVEEAK